MPDKNRYWVPTLSYDVEVVIKNLKYEVFRVEIASSITTPYQAIILDLFVDAEDIILKQLWGGESIKMTIRFFEEVNTPLDQIEYELLYVSNPSGLNLSLKPQNEELQHKDRSPIRIVTVPKDSFKTMSTLVNKIYVNKTPKEIIEDLVTETDANLKYDPIDANTNSLDQVIIPPLTIYQSIKYLDAMFGLHDGISVFFCDYENNLKVMNLSPKIKDSQLFTIFQLTSDGLDNNKIIEKTSDGKHFITYTPISTDYIGNSVFSVLAKNMKFVVKPKDELYSIIEKDLETIASKQGLVSEGDKVYLDEFVSERTKYYTEHTGYGTSEFFINFAKKISSLSVVTLYLERNLNILNLIKVGETVKFDPKHPNYSDLTGMYILRSSAITLYKENDWQITARVDLIRTNKTK